MPSDSKTLTADTTTINMQDRRRQQFNPNDNKRRHDFNQNAVPPAMGYQMPGTYMAGNPHVLLGLLLNLVKFGPLLGASLIRLLSGVGFHPVAITALSIFAFVLILTNVFRRRRSIKFLMANEHLEDDLSKYKHQARNLFGLQLTLASVWLLWLLVGFIPSIVAILVCSAVLALVIRASGRLDEIFDLSKHSDQGM